MKRRNAQTIGDVLNNFFDENPELRKRIMEIRIQRGWGDVLGPQVQQYTRTIYVRDGVLYVSLSSSVLRSELNYCRDRLIRSLNEYAGSAVIREIVLR